MSASLMGELESMAGVKRSSNATLVLILTRTQAPWRRPGVQGARLTSAITRSVRGGIDHLKVAVTLNRFLADFGQGSLPHAEAVGGIAHGRR